MICAARCKFNDAYKGPHGNISASYSDRVEINVLCRDFFCSNTDHDLIELSQIDSGLAFDLAQFCRNRSQHRLVGRKDCWDRIIEKPSGIERGDAVRSRQQGDESGRLTYLRRIAARIRKRKTRKIQKQHKYSQKSKKFIFH